MPGEKSSDTYCTPAEVAALLGPVDLDPCSNDRSLVQATRRVALPEDGLVIPWRGLVFCNPPYSAVMPWVLKAIRSSAEDASTVTLLLVKCDPSVRWWAALMDPHANHTTALRLFRRRLAFEHPDNPQGRKANFPSAMALVVPRCVTPWRDTWSLANAAMERLTTAGWLWPSQ